VSLGTWQLGGKWGEQFDEKTAMQIMEKAVEDGINFFDTADVYNNGLSEIAIGKFLKQAGKKIYVATKCGRKLSPHTSEGYNEKNIKTFIDDSLARLQVDAIDLIQLHCPPTDVYYNPEVFEVLEDIKKAGKILHYGVSVEKVQEAIKAADYPGVASVQIIYNMFRLKPQEQFFDIAVENNIGIIARVPLASGLLTGKFTKESTFGKGDHRNFNREGKFFDRGETFSGVPYEVGIDAAEELKNVFGPDDLTKYAIKWILDSDKVSCVIPGMSSSSQMRANIEASEMPPLSAEQLSSVKNIYDKYIREHVHSLW
jgi:aryl-alcohol dehydrogenase-like predicted oxidoreductase